MSVYVVRMREQKRKHMVQMLDLRLIWAILRI